ncbi:ThuA domain-containing protein [Streptomyces hoynatensis]|uniref:Trehalose utilization protein ThuA n=1 Tax=Streptomyces hoynatensis TaxID=1141874 RepID=A0A3A9Z9F9_9ACTN|nr:ThuA domain-containing protein [Streptomyces hoynatensis]RKN44779.1 trehalose utilization protein ThuA [Streptomyces hoynatensis]
MTHVNAARAIRATVWAEDLPRDPAVQAAYPAGLHTAIADGLTERGLAARTSGPGEPEQGLGGELLAGTDVLFWWAHARHEEVSDAAVARVRDRVLSGMGLVLLHSAMESKIFRALLGTSGRIGGWRHGDREAVWTVDPTHPIAAGVPQPILLREHEMYCEPFDVPTPDELVFVSGFAGGEVFRSGLAYRRGLGRLFYFSPGHESCPVYHREDIRTVLANAARWAAGERQGASAEAPAPWPSLRRAPGWYAR